MKIQDYERRWEQLGGAEKREAESERELVPGPMPTLAVLRRLFERVLDVLGVGGLGACDCGREQRMMGKEVELAWQAAGSLKEGFLRSRLEERELGPCEAQ